MDDQISFLLPLIPGLALLGALVTLLGARVLRGKSHYVVIACLAAAFVSSVFLLIEVGNAASSSGERGFERTVTLWTWAVVPDAYYPDPSNSRDFRVDVTLRADALTCVMLSMVTFVSTLVAFFAAGYMRGDPGYWRFFAYFGLFVFSMTMLVSVSNFVLLFAFWEAVGLCSYLLIGFWYQKPEAAAAGKKAFLVNRVGDFGFTLALFFIWITYGTLSFHDASPPIESGPMGSIAGESLAADTGVTQAAGVLGQSRIAAGNYVGGTLGFVICVLLLVGACGKSAQVPLHVWLPDAMEGPTPVSALIHAATMVTAGIYMITRCAPLFMVSPAAQLLVACIGAATALLAALIALTQYDLKRVLAYSTVSQLGYMFMGLGVGTFAGMTAGMFHLFTHAFFKALLFLGAGSVMHAMGNVIDMRRFGGLRRIMPITHITFFVGCLALAGFPGLSGFWSKDAIVAALHEKGHHHPSEHHDDLNDDAGHAGHDDAGHQDPHAETTGAAGADPSTAHHAASVDHGTEDYAAIYQVLYGIALFTAFLTAFYTFRALYMTFYGPRQVPYEAGDHAHESPRIMSWPLCILAVGAAGIGIVLDQTWRLEPRHYFAEFLGSTPSLAGGAVAATREPFVFHSEVAATSAVIAFVAILLATFLYLGGQREVQWLRSLLDFEGVAGTGRDQWFAGNRRLSDAAERAHLGWLLRAVGGVLSTIWLVLSAPFLLGNFVSPYKLSHHKFFIDELYHFAIVLPLRMLAAVCYAFDRWVVDGLVNTVGRVPPVIGGSLRHLQLGLVPFYTLAMVLGALVLAAARILWAGG